MKRHIELTYALFGFGIGERLTVDFSGVGDHAGDGAEPACDAQRARVDMRRQRIGEHGRIKFIRFAVGVEIGAGKMRVDERCAQRHDACENLLHKAVLRAAQGHGVEVGPFDEGRRIDAAAVG